MQILYQSTLRLWRNWNGVHAFFPVNKSKKMLRRIKIRYHFYFFLLDLVELLVVPDSFFREEEDF